MSFFFSRPTFLPAALTRFPAAFARAFAFRRTLGSFLTFSRAFFASAVAASAIMLFASFLVLPGLLVLLALLVRLALRVRVAMPSPR